MLRSISTSVPAERGHMSSNAKRPGARPPSRRAIRGLFEWIESAHAAQQIWARNALVVVGAIIIALWAALRLGWLNLP